MKKYRVTVNGTTYEVDVEQIGGNTEPSVQSSNSTAPAVATPAKSETVSAAVVSTSATSASKNVSAPMPGTILKVAVHSGDTVKKGDLLMVLEAMKMENDIVAPEDGTIVSVAVSQGTSVSTGDMLVSYN